MADAKLLKALIMIAASNLAAAIMGRVTAALPVDATIANPALRTANLMLWELERIFFHALGGAMDADDSWPAPKVGAAVGAALPDLLGPLVSQAGPVGALATQLLAALKASVAPVPAPGA